MNIICHFILSYYNPVAAVYEEMITINYAKQLDLD